MFFVLKAMLEQLTGIFSVSYKISQGCSKRIFKNC